MDKNDQPRYIDSLDYKTIENKFMNLGDVIYAEKPLLQDIPVIEGSNYVMNDSLLNEIEDLLSDSIVDSFSGNKSFRRFSLIFLINQAYHELNNFGQGYNLLVEGTVSNLLTKKILEENKIEENRLNLIPSSELFVLLDSSYFEDLDKVGEFLNVLDSIESEAIKLSEKEWR